MTAAHEPRVPRTPPGGDPAKRPSMVPPVVPPVVPRVAAGLARGALRWGRPGTAEGLPPTGPIGVVPDEPRSFAAVQRELALIEPQTAAMMRPLLPHLVDRISTQIQGQVNAYAGPRSGRRRRLIEQAVGGAGRLYVESIEGRAVNPERVEELFRRMGYGEAMEGNSLQAMLSAYDIATHDAWDELRDFAVTEGLPAQVLGSFGDALFALMRHLTDQVVTGYDDGCAAADRDLQRGREHLLDALLRGDATEQVERLAAAIGWMPPAQVVVCAAETTMSHALPAELPGDSQLLARIKRPVSVLVLDAIDMPGGLVEARSWFSHGRLAVSWPVPLEEVPDALRWAERALRLADLGVLEVGPVIDCDEHLPALWLHSEPVMRRRLTQRSLGPLLGETPHTRAVLAETLMAWLDSHASAPVLGERLSVHPQTVRYRMRKLRTLFGDRLDDPEESLAISLALRASLPLWRNGHLGEDLRAHEAESRTER